MAVEIRRPEKKEDDGLNKLLAVTQIAGSVSGMAKGSGQTPSGGEAEAPQENAMARYQKKLEAQRYGGYA